MGKKLNYLEYRIKRSHTMEQVLNEDGLVVLTPTAKTLAFEKAQARNIQFQGTTDLNLLFGVHR